MAIFAPPLTYTLHFAEHLHVSVESSACMCRQQWFYHSSQSTIPHRVFSLKHSVHSMISHCALHSSHLSVSSTKDILPLLEDCRSGTVQSPFLGHLSFLFHHLLWAVASPGKIFGYMLEKTFIYCKGFCTPQEQVQPPIKPRVRAEKGQHSNTNFLHF